MAQITVMMAAYNAEKYIRRAVDSVLAQTFPDFDLIIADDGSRDATGDIADAPAVSGAAGKMQKRAQCLISGGIR